MSSAAVQHLKRTGAVVYDHALRFWVQSRSDVNKQYLVQLDSYDANGECQCKDFVCRFEKLIKEGVTPEVALRDKLVKARPGKHDWDALRCEHIVEARAEAADMFVNALADAERRHV